MRTVFADTAYYVALTNPRDQYAAVAAEFTASFDGEILTTAWVLTELANFLASPRSNRELFLDIRKDLIDDPRVTVVSATQEWFDRGIELFGGRLDKDWSLTDCISIAAMRQFGLTEALTSDHHFEQAGFTILLK